MSIASAGVGLHPLICLLEEAHVAIQDATYGKEIAKLLIDIVKLGRKRGIHLIISTQAPTKDSMPRDVTRNCSNGIAFAVGDHVANDALLGQGAYAAGHRATELIPGTDRGTAVVKGFTGERCEILQWYYLDVSRGNDQVTPLIERSLHAIAKLGRPTPDSRADRRSRPATCSPTWTTCSATTRARSPTCPRCSSGSRRAGRRTSRLTGKALRERLAAEYGIKVPSTGNRYPLDPATSARHSSGEEQDTGRRGRRRATAAEVDLPPAPPEPPDGPPGRISRTPANSASLDLTSRRSEPHYGRPAAG